MTQTATPLAPLLALLVALAAAPALAQTGDHGAHGAGHAGHGTAAATSPSSAAFAEANARMHSAMAVPLTGDADVDFIAGMIPHHQGAVDMARIVLEHGTDPEVRKLAETIIANQEAEIKWMTDWLAKNAKAN